MPRARILTFGYDADIVRVIDAASSNTIRDHGKALATELSRKSVLDGCVSIQHFLKACTLSSNDLARKTVLSSLWHTALEDWFASRSVSNLKFFPDPSNLL